MDFLNEEIPAPAAPSHSMRSHPHAHPGRPDGDRLAGQAHKGTRRAHMLYTYLL